jgi:hypothetical protein
VEFKENGANYARLSYQRSGSYEERHRINHGFQDGFIHCSRLVRPMFTKAILMHPHELHSCPFA